MKPGRSQPKAQGARATTYSTSEARANFAEAMEAAQRERAVIGFDRYGQTVAALVPLEAIYILAGKGDRIAPATREKIERAARNLVQDILQPDAQLKVAGPMGKALVPAAGLKPAAKRPRASKRRSKA